MTKSIINDIAILYEALGEGPQVPSLRSPVAAPPIPSKIAPAPTSKVASTPIGPAMSTDETLEDIVRDIFGIKTLKVRNMDDLDFYEVHVANLKKALEQAYQAGRLSN